jgi:hypothetical protein
VVLSRQPAGRSRSSRHNGLELFHMFAGRVCRERRKPASRRVTAGMLWETTRPHAAAAGIGVRRSRDLTNRVTAPRRVAFKKTS